MRDRAVRVEEVGRLQQCQRLSLFECDSGSRIIVGHKGEGGAVGIGEVDGDLLAPAGDGDSRGARQIGPQHFEVEEGAVERTVQRLLGDGEDLALG